MAGSQRKSASKTASKARYALLVLGMHRSGTSALSGTLALLGAQPPRSLMAANEGNSRGYWESNELMKVHDKILQSAGTRWDDWGRFNPDWLDSPVAPGFAEMISETIDAEYGDSSLLLVKDPRICRFFPLWGRVLEQKGIKPKIILPVRNPHDVAKSLEVRNKFCRSRTLLLWLRHELDAELATRGMDRAFVSYEGLLSNWKAEVIRLASCLDIKWPRWSSETELRISDFLTANLRHHASPDAERASGEGLNKWISTVYGLLNELAAGGEDDVDKLRELDSVREEFDRTSSVYGIVLGEQEYVAKKMLEDARARMKEATERAESLKCELDDARKKSGDTQSEVSAQISKLQSQLQVSAGEMSKVSEEATLLRKQVVERDGKLKALTAARDELQEKTMKQEGELGRRMEEESALIARIDAMQSELQASMGMLAKNNEQSDMLRQHIAERDDSVREVMALRDGLAGKVDELQRRLADSTEVLTGKNADILKNQKEIARLCKVVLQLESELSDKESVIRRREAALAEGAAAIRKGESAIRQHEQDAINTRAEISARDRTIRAHAAQIDQMRLEHKRMKMLLEHSNASRLAVIEVNESAITRFRKYTDDAASAVSTIRRSALWRLAGPVRRRFDGPDAEVPGIATVAEIELQAAETIRRSGLFDVDWYIATNADVVTSGMDPVMHYLRVGAPRGADPSKAFSTLGYIERHGDIRRAGVNPLLHYIQFGQKEGRAISPSLASR